MKTAIQAPAHRPGPRTHFVTFRMTPEEKLQARTLARKAGHKGDVSALLRDLLARAAQEPRPQAHP